MIREVERARDLEALVELRRRIDPLTATTAADLRHFVGEARAALCALAHEDGQPVGFAWVATWYDEPYASGTLGVLPASRGRGHGTALLERAVARFPLLQLGVDDGPAVAWLERRGFEVADRQARVVLDLAHATAPPARNAAVELTDAAERPDLMPQLHPLFLAGNEDVPGALADDPPVLDAWLEGQQAPSRRPDFRVIALDAGEPVGYAQLHVYPGVGHHGFTTVARTHRRRGLARELKVELIRRAQSIGLRRLITQSNEATAPMRALNASLGYRDVAPLVYLRRTHAD